MKNYWVYYRVNPTFRTYGSFDNEKEKWLAIYDSLEKETLVNPLVYAFVAYHRADNIDDVYQWMQGDVWSPNGEARSIIKRLGLQHTSMSVGDLIVEEGGNVYEVDSVGWKRILKDGNPV